VSGAPFKLASLDHVVLRVPDMGQALAFYRDVLGAVIERRLERLGMVQLRVGASIIDLVDLNGDWMRAAGAKPFTPDSVNVDHICIRIEPFDEAAIEEHLRHHGVAIGEKGIRYGAQGDGPSIYVRDPFGTTVELKGPATPIEADAPVLKTARLVLRPMRRSDAEALLPLFSDGETLRYWAFGPIETLSQMHEIIAGNLPPQNAPQSSFAITRAGRAVGVVNFYRQQDGMAGLGYILDRALWGQGFVSEAIDSALDHGFGTLNLHRIWLEIDPRNHASIRVAEKCGFVAEGVARESFFLDGAYLDSVYYSMLRAEWLTLRGLGGSGRLRGG
jgi:glyoxylase I family protein